MTLTAVNSGGCAAEAQDAIVYVSDAVRADFTLSPQANPTQIGTPLSMYLPATGVDFRDLSQGGAIQWRWDFGDGIQATEQHPQHSYRSPGEYAVTLMATNEAGCVSKIVHGPIIIQAPDLFIPNVFSPNSDATNDAFLVEYKGSQPFRMQVFDRWGVLLHESKNKQKGWDGSNMKGNSMPEGVYYYVVSVGDQDYTGPVSLLR